MTPRLSIPTIYIFAIIILQKLNTPTLLSFANVTVRSLPQRRKCISTSGQARCSHETHVPFLGAILNYTSLCADQYLTVLPFPFPNRPFLGMAHSSRGDTSGAACVLVRARVALFAPRRHMDAMMTMDAEWCTLTACAACACVVLHPSHRIRTHAGSAFPPSDPPIAFCKQCAYVFVSIIMF